jgi:hypothetical protein
MATPQHRHTEKIVCGTVRYFENSTNVQNEQREIYPTPKKLNNLKV